MQNEHILHPPYPQPQVSSVDNTSSRFPFLISSYSLAHYCNIVTHKDYSIRYRFNQHPKVFLEHMTNCTVGSSIYIYDEPFPYFPESSFPFSSSPYMYPPGWHIWTFRLFFSFHHFRSFSFSNESIRLLLAAIVVIFFPFSHFPQFIVSQSNLLLTNYLLSLQSSTHSRPNWKESQQLVILYSWFSNGISSPWMHICCYNHLPLMSIA